jgi:L-rhamnose mutarotase
MSRRYCFALDLKDDPNLIAQYRKHHQDVWPEIIQSIRSAGIEEVEIWLVGSRLFMILDAGPSFSLEAKETADRENPKVQEWEQLMSKFQQPLPQARPGEKWLAMERIFKLEA